MKKHVLLSGLLVAANCLMAQTNPFFSEYIEGTSNNKALEIYNPTSSAIDLTASNYVVQVFANGALITAPTNTIALTGTIEPGKTFVISHTLFALVVPVGTVQQKNASINFNGDDAVILKKGGASGEILDVIGQVGTDPGTEWKTGTTTTLNMTITRKLSITNGDIIPSDAFDVASEWIATSVDDVSNLGKHNSTIVVSKFTLTPENLSFSTSAINTPSLSKKFVLVNNDTINNFKVVAGTNFEVSKDSLTGFVSSFKDTSLTQNQKAFKYFVRYVPSSGFSHTSKVLIDSILPSKSSLALNVSGQVISTSVIPISAIQSDKKSTPFKGVPVIVEGVVTKDLQKATEQKGFFIQDLSPDTSNLTSEGIFVFDSLGSVDVVVGNVVKVSGTADELFNQTVIRKVTSIIVTKAQNDLPTPVTISLPVDSIGVFERYEGMLVNFSQKLAVTEVYNLGRYGEILLSPNTPLITPTNFIDPNDVLASGNTFTGTSNISAIKNQVDLNNRSKIVLADDNNTENPNPIPFIDPTTKTLRVGSTIDTLRGVLSFDFGVYRIYTVNKPKFNYDSRPTLPPTVGNANVKIAAMNVLNFFNGDGNGGGFPTARGAKNMLEFQRQKTKLVAAIKGLDADIVGVMEVENDGDGAKSALKELIDTINVSQSIENKYAFVMETGANGNPGTDQIKVGILYKPSRVTPSGVASFYNTASFTSLGRPPLAQTFSLNSNGEKVTVVVNHFKSKGCGTLIDLDSDQLDGQSCYNDTRKKQADELLIFINSIIDATNDSDVVTIGDFNAYNEEDPLDKFRVGGLQNLLANSYSYVFDGQLGALDHAFATKSLVKQMTGVDKWHINSVEPRIIDYTTAFKTQDLFVANAFRSSDHDPLLMGFDLVRQVITDLENQEKSNGLNVYPNPVKRGHILNFNSNANATLHNALGNEVSKSSLNGEINTENLVSGIYFLNIRGSKTVKVIITD